MAVYAAHLTRTLQGTPSVFQVTAQEALGATVKPALRKVVEYLAAVYPNRCGWCVQWYDELYLLFDCCLQYHYLKHYAASFSESFYGLVRVPTLVSNEFNSGQRLPQLLERASLAALVLAPYLRDKLDALIERWREEDEDGRLGKSRSDKARKAAIRVYSIVHVVREGTKLIQLAAYLCGAAQAHCPALALLGLSLTNAPPTQPDHDTWADLFRSLATGHLGSAVISFPMVGRLALGAVEYGAFLVQFLRWWETRDALPHATTLPAPPPPQFLRWWETRDALPHATTLPAPPPPQVHHTTLPLHQIVPGAVPALVGDAGRAATRHHPARATTTAGTPHHTTTTSDRSWCSSCAGGRRGTRCHTPPPCPRHHHRRYTTPHYHYIRSFLVQFLRWWETRDALPHATTLPAPPPPQKDERALRWKNKCPICLQTWKIPTVLPVSGYIFCYVCISRELRARGVCPVSRCPAIEHSLVRLYID